MSFNEAKEMLPIVVAVVVWGASWAVSVVMCHCDNHAVAGMVQGSYRDQSMANTLSCLFFLETKDSVTLIAQGVRICCGQAYCHWELIFLIFNGSEMNSDAF